MFQTRIGRLRFLPVMTFGLSMALFSACEPSNVGGLPEEVTVNLPSEGAIDEALASITEEEIREHTQVLASDEFGGRGPSSRGEELTIQYLTEQSAALGLEPAGEEGTWVQEVPVVAITADPDMTLTINGGSGPATFEYGSEFVAGTPRVVERVGFEGSEMVFVGYGAVAPEFGWDDYAEVDVSGKTVIVLVNDPGFATQDPDLFKGNAMTYYGRWTYKYEEGARQGAAAVLIVHETAPAAYGWATVENGWTGTQFNLVAEDNNMDRVAAEGWITLETAESIFEMAGLDYQELKARAQVPGFEAVSLGDLTASLEITNTIERSSSKNFLARIPGTTRPDEVVIYMGHWDHFGMDITLEGDQVYNGAVDNASGVATILEIAEAFTLLDPGPERTVVFWGTTLEEQGLLGSAYYAENPVYPLHKTAAAINIDALPITGATHDYTIIGFGNSGLDEYAVRANAPIDRTVKPNPEPEKGSFYRSDHFPLAKQGVPAHYGSAGHDNIEHGEEWSRAQSDAWTAENYHQVTDEYSAGWDLGGAMQDVFVWFRIGLELAYSNAFPTWNEGTEFKAIRDAMMGG
ncbi:MAG: M28 family peptidase [Gemmatimonadetes bacterium]|nr:M28 family peptidase [Gemmatimonadota bacterium]NNM06223.1 M28 family peptidase [Gemmatimonadota bacterium]